MSLSKRSGLIAGFDHAQLIMPRGRESDARAFYGELLGLKEIAKPASLAGRGGVWFGLPDGRQLHLGVEEPCAPSAKTHLAFAASDLDATAGALAEAGFPVLWDDALAPRRRFYSADSFGNRLEFLE